MLTKDNEIFEYNLDSTSYAARDLKYISRNLIKSKDVANAKIGFIFILLIIATLIIFSVALNLFGSTLGLIVGIFCLGFPYSYLFMKTIDIIKKRKASPSLSISFEIMLFFFLSQVALIAVFSSLFYLITHFLLSCQKLNFPVKSLLHLSIIKLLFISTFIGFLIIFILIIGYFVISKILPLIFYIYASRGRSINDSIRIGFKLGFKNIFRLIGIDFSFIGLALLSIITLDILLIWKILYIYTSKSILMEKILKDNNII
ncbi:MAG: hypothetical protein ACRDAU_06865 [Clostridium sp.]